MRWKNGTLDLGRLGMLRVTQTAPCAWLFEWQSLGGIYVRGPYDLTSEARAKRSAESWMRKAIAQASSRLARATQPSARRQ